MTFLLYLLCPFASILVQTEMMMAELVKGQGAKATANLVLLNWLQKSSSKPQSSRENCKLVIRQNGENEKQLHMSFPLKN